MNNPQDAGCEPTPECLRQRETHHRRLAAGAKTLAEAKEHLAIADIFAREAAAALKALERARLAA
jgi:hypothetical protein